MVIHQIFLHLGLSRNRKTLNAEYSPFLNGHPSHKCPNAISPVFNERNPPSSHFRPIITFLDRWKWRRGRVYGKDEVGDGDEIVFDDENIK
jgi:hypothetical protein